MIKNFLDTHGNGFWLHGLGAIAIVLLFWFMCGMPAVGQAINFVLWPGREWLQHRASTIFTWHRTLEWGTPIITGFLTLSLLKLI